MPKNTRIDDAHLQWALQEHSIRALIAEDSELDEILGFGDKSKVEKETLDDLLKLLKPLKGIEFAALKDHVSAVEDKILKLAGKGGFMRWLTGGGGEKSKRLVGSITALTTVARELGEQLRDEDALADNIGIHDMNDADKDTPMSAPGILDKKATQWIDVYADSVYDANNKGGELKELGLKSKDIAKMILSLKANEIKTVADALGGLAPPEAAAEELEAELEDVAEEAEEAGEAGEAAEEAGEAAEEEEEAAAPGGGASGPIGAREFGKIVNDNRELFQKIADKGGGGTRARKKIRGFFKGRTFSEAVQRRLESKGLGLLVEEVKADHHDHARELDDYRRWRQLSGME